MDPLSIGGAIEGLKTAGKIAGSFVDLRDQAMIQGRVIELQSVILAAQGSALAAQSEQLALLAAKRDLERQVAGAEAWEREKLRYRLEEVRGGAFVYSLKPEAQNGEPMHKICASCYERGHKSLLQEGNRPPRLTYIRCHDCSLELVTQGIDDRPPAPRPSPVGRADVFRR